LRVTPRRGRGRINRMNIEKGTKVRSTSGLERPSPSDRPWERKGRRLSKKEKKKRILERNIL